MDSKDGTMDYDATMERGGGSYARRSVTWASASGGDPAVLNAMTLSIETPDPDARLVAVERKEPEMMDLYQIMGTTQADMLRQQASAEIDRGTERAAALLAKAAFLESLPAEPQVQDGEPNIVYFEKVFDQGGTVYNYAAIQFHDAWYTSGPAAGDTPRTWPDLVKWIYTYRNGATRDDVQIWHATGYEPL